MNTLITIIRSFGQDPGVAISCSRRLRSPICNDDGAITGAVLVIEKIPG